MLGRQKFVKTSH